MTAQLERLCDDPPTRGRGPDHDELGNHRFRATGITANLKNRGTLEKPPRWRTTHRHARRNSMTAGATSLASMRSSG
jgi:hypothetical protein